MGLKPKESKCVTVDLHVAHKVFKPFSRQRYCHPINEVSKKPSNPSQNVVMVVWGTQVEGRHQTFIQYDRHRNATCKRCAKRPQSKIPPEKAIDWPPGCADHKMDRRAQQLLLRRSEWNPQGETLEKAGGELLTHDAGQHDHISLLCGLISRADYVVFPVDCVGHEAALAVKRLCRQFEKRWMPLRSSDVASFLYAMLEAPDAALI